VATNKLENNWLLINIPYYS